MGAKSAFELFPGGLKARSKEERRKRWDRWQREAVTAATAAVAAAKKVDAVQLLGRQWAAVKLLSRTMQSARQLRECACKTSVMKRDNCMNNSGTVDVPVQGGKATTEAAKKALEEVELRVKLLTELQEKFEDLGESGCNMASPRAAPAVAGALHVIQA